ADAAKTALGASPDKPDAAKAVTDKSDSTKTADEGKPKDSLVSPAGGTTAAAADASHPADKKDNKTETAQVDPSKPGGNSDKPNAGQGAASSSSGADSSDIKRTAAVDTKAPNNFPLGTAPTATTPSIPVASTGRGSAVQPPAKDWPVEFY